MTGACRNFLYSVEGYRNNSLGTWIELFGTMLPGTGAPPDVRLDYLREASLSDDVRVRSLVVKAAARAQDIHEFIIAAGELQGGKLLEQRGMPATRGEAWDYRNGTAAGFVDSLS